MYESVKMKVSAPVFPEHTSGAMYGGLPIGSSITFSSRITRAVPKSASFNVVSEARYILVILVHMQ